MDNKVTEGQHRCDSFRFYAVDDVFIRGFNKDAKLARLALMPTLYFHAIALSFFIYTKRY